MILFDFAGECVVSKLPRDGSLWNLDDEKLIPGEVVSGSITTKCNEESTVPVDRISHCVNGEWIPPIPDCKCAPLDDSEVPTVCSHNGGAGTICTDPQFNTTATMKCPSNYFYAQQTLLCDGNGRWTSMEAWKPCRYHCGDYKGDITRWDIILRKSTDNTNLCHVAILNRAYVLVGSTCVENYTPSELIVWDYGVVYAVQSIEYAGKYKLIRTKRPIQYAENTMPLCLNDDNVELAGGVNWSRDPIQRCRVDRTGADGFYAGGSCPVDDAECIYSYGTAFHQESKYEVEGIKRRYLYGIGYRVERKGENQDGFYECHYNESEWFRPQDRFSLDFTAIEKTDDVTTSVSPSIEKSTPIKGIYCLSNI